MNTIRRFHAPTATGELLAEPAFDQVPNGIESNRRLLDTNKVLIGGIPLSQFREQARNELFAASNQPAPSGPIIITGHQPELSHPGVWLKTFAAAGYSQKLNGTALNLVVDTDAVKSLAVRLPVWNADPKRVHVELIGYDTGEVDVAYEMRSIDDESHFESFPDRTAAITKNWNDQPILDQAWKTFVNHQGTLGERFVAGRTHFEEEWGCSVPMLAVSRMSQTESFRQFASHILSDLPRFITSYNTAVQAYRVKYRLRSQTHPVPELRPGEAPFWTMQNGVRQPASAQSPMATLRPRALTLTLFCRLCVGDWFIHGIGGGKYDEVTDSIIRDFFEIEAPAFQVLTGTMRLSFPLFTQSQSDVYQLNRRLRDLHWNPQRFTKPESLLFHDDDRAAWHRRIELQSIRPETKALRRERAQELKALNEQLRPFVSELKSQTEQELELAVQDAHANAILQNREYSWILYPEPILKTFLQSVMNRAYKMA